MSPLKNADPSVNEAPLFNWRTHLPVHPAAELFPLMKDMDPAGFKGLVEDIRVHGLIEPIVGWVSNEGVSVLDGRNRLDALAQLGLLCEMPDHHVGIKKWTGKQWSDRPGARIDGHDGAFWNIYDREGLDPYDIVLSFNIHRRHLTAELKRELIAKVLKAKPEASNVSIAKQVKVDDKTVASVRRDLESNSEIPNKPRVEANGRKARGRKPGTKPAVSAVPTTPMPVGTDISTDVAPSTTTTPGDLTVEELAAALEKVGAKKLIAALDLVPEVKAAVVKYAVRQHGRPRINKEMTNALRAGLGTNAPAKNQAAITKITMELGRLHLDRNDISVVVRKPLPDMAHEPETDESAPTSRLIPGGNGAAHAATNDDGSIPPFLRREPPRLA
jgi:hypothetical protein